MRKLLLLAAVMLCHTSLALAQGEGKKGQPVPRYEFFVGYSRVSVNNRHCLRGAEGGCRGKSDLRDSDSDFFKSRAVLEGFETSLTRGLGRNVGFKSDFSGHFKTDVVTTIRPLGLPFTGTPHNQFVTESRLYQFMAGPELKARNQSRLTPFAHALAGVARSRQRLTPLAPQPAFNEVRSTRFPHLLAGGARGAADGFAAALGGGLDLRASERFSVRSSFDYNPSRFDRELIYGGFGVQNNFRTSVGFLFH